MIAKKFGSFACLIVTVNRCQQQKTVGRCPFGLHTKWRQTHVQLSGWEHPLRLSYQHQHSCSVQKPASPMVKIIGELTAVYQIPRLPIHSVPSRCMNPMVTRLRQKPASGLLLPMCPLGTCAAFQSTAVVSTIWGYVVSLQ